MGKHTFADAQIIKFSNSIEHNYAKDIKHFRSLENNNEKAISCWAPFQAMHIDKKANCGPCPFSLTDTPDMFEWRPDNSLLDIWNNPIMERMRDIHLEGDINRVWCKYCNNSRDEGKPPSSLDFDHIGGKLSLNHSYPQELELELSNKCNYMCNACSPWCSSKHMEKLPDYVPNDIRFSSVFDDPEMIKIFVEDLRSIIHHMHRLNFTGGEPFAQRPVYEILKMINEENPKDLHIHFTTNGSVMNGMVKKLAARPNTHFTISLDSIDPIKYPLIRVNGELDNVLSNIDIYQSLCTGVIGCSFVIQRDNVYDLPKIVSWCNEKEIIFSYHIMSRMGRRDSWESLGLAEHRVEGQNSKYLNKLRKYLLSAKLESTGSILSGKNIEMYHQYIERIK